MELLIDGVRHKLWTPKIEAELEAIIQEHAKDIFGEDSIYFNIKQKIKSKAGTGSIPDGYVIIVGDEPGWYIVEVELTSHDPYGHILSQMTRFIHSISNVSSQNEIVDAIYKRVNEDEILKTSIKQRLGGIEIHSFLSDLISHDPVLAIIIEEETEKLREVSKTLSKIIETQVIEFKTFEREGVGSIVHAHLFEPLYKPTSNVEQPYVAPTIGGITPTKKKEDEAIQQLLDTGLIQVKQKIFKNHKGRRYEGEILTSDKIRLLHDGTEWGSVSRAGTHITKYQVNGWTWWLTIANGEECSLDKLRRKI